MSSGMRIKALAANELHAAATALRHHGGRVQFAYAWSPDASSREVRYVCAVPGQRDFETWAVAGRTLPSLAPVVPLLGWYEREMMDLQGIAFEGHPEPHPLVLRENDSTRINGGDLKSASPTNGHAHLPAIETGDVQQLPFGPIRADVVESAEFTFFYIGERIIYYQPRLFFKHRGMESCFQGQRPDQAVVIAERVSGVGTLAHALAYCEAIERGRMHGAPARASLARSPRRDGADLQPSPLSRPSLSHDLAEGRRGAGQAAGGKGQAIDRAPDRQPLPARPVDAGRTAARSRARPMARSIA